MIYHTVTFVFGWGFEFTVGVAAVFTAFYIVGNLKKDLWTYKVNGFAKSKSVMLWRWWAGHEQEPKTMGEAAVFYVHEALKRSKENPDLRTHPCVDMRKPMALNARSCFKEKWRPNRVPGFRSKLASWLHKWIMEVDE